MSRARKTSLSALLETLGGTERIAKLQLDPASGGLVCVEFFPPPPQIIDLNADEIDSKKPAERPKDWRYALEDLDPVERRRAVETGVASERNQRAGDPFGKAS